MRDGNLNFQKKSVDGIFTSAIQRKGFGVRQEVKVETEDGVKTVKFLKLTPEGMAVDTDAE